MKTIINGNRSDTARALLAGIFCVLFLAGQFTPANAAPNTAARQKAGLSLSLTQWPAARVCLHGIETIGFAITLPKNTPPIGAQVTVSANLGNVTYSFDEFTGSGNIAYEAVSEGDIKVVIKARWNEESTSGQISFKVRPCGYTISIQGLSVDASGTASMYQYISGRGTFSRVGEYKTIEGAGEFKYEMALWSGATIVQCSMEPSIKASNTFQVISADLPALWPGDFTVSVKFEPLTIPNTELKCTDTLSNYQIAPIPLPGGPTDFNTYLNLSQMYFKAMGGEHLFKFGNGSGTVTVIPRINP